MVSCLGCGADGAGVEEGAARYGEQAADGEGEGDQEEAGEEVGEGYAVDCSGGADLRDSL